jgi:integrase
MSVIAHKLTNEFNKHSGLSRHGKRIRLSFRYMQRRHLETLDIPITIANIKIAAQKLAAIKHEIAVGSFEYIEHFPNSRKSKNYSNKLICTLEVSDAISRYLETIALTTAPSTYKAYSNKAKNHILPKFANRVLTDITQSELKLWMAKDLRALSPKTINNINVPFRAIFKEALADGIIEKDPFTFIKQLKENSNEPDPFTRAEMKVFAFTATKRLQEVHAFLFSCWTGLRPSELIALAWEDVDFVHKTIKIRRGKVDSTIKSTKTDGSVRTIELLSPAIELLNQQKPLSYYLPPNEVDVLSYDYKSTSKANLRFIFLNSLTLEPFSDVSNYRGRFFDPHIKKAGIRYRSPKQARHTFACQLLTAGIDIYWIAKQLGHTSIKMIEKHYGKWMNIERSDMAQQVSEKLGFVENDPVTIQKITEIF